jgi:hypothetical protein
MTISMYSTSIPTFIRGLENLSAILTKAENYALAKKIDPSVLINARLAPDMFALSKQVQIAADMVKGFAARISGAEIPKYEDNEKTFEELRARIAKTIAFLKSVDAKKVDGSEQKHIAFKIGGMDLSFNGSSYLLGFVIPNFYFHITTAYAILRHNGLDIGKGDFLGSM